ncbi:MAG: Uma2 family endonuclease [Gemmataceae bacterium]|nr:Uma2 family endonuclease [Gemmataceae bacterium]
MTTIPKLAPPTEADVHYPESDGKPMGETEYHVDALIDLKLALKYHFRRRDLYVALDMFLYYEKGNPKAVKAPDVMIIRGVSKHRRTIFRIWEEKAVPCVIFEITSDSTVDEDLGDKLTLYARLGVVEYFVFDPRQSCLDPPLQGFRLKGKKYAPLAPDKDGSLTSQELGLKLALEGDRLRLTDINTGKRLLTSDERAERATQRAQQQKQRAEQEKQRADALAAEVDRLRAELERRNLGTK